MSMRTLATRLGVQPSALYWHFPSKQALLTAVAERVLSGVGAAAAGGRAADELRGVGGALRGAVAGVPDGAEIVALGLAAGARNPVAEAVGQVCRRHGLDGRGAGMATAITAYVLGLAVGEQTRHNRAAGEPTV